MEDLKIQQFLLNLGDGHGYGDGSGYGAGNGNGSGYGSGAGNGYGNDSDYGYGYSSVSRSLSIKSINNINMLKIDGLLTGITQIKNNIAKGFMLNSDMTTTKCYIVKQNNVFAHGSTLRDAYNSLNMKLFVLLSKEERIDEFFKQFNLQDKYPAKQFFDWHYKLTGSCLLGREQFVKNHNIDLEKDMFTVTEFVELTKNSYGGEIIGELI